MPRIVEDEHFLDHRVAQRFACGVGQQVLFGHVGDIFRIGIFREQMVERLVLAGTHFLRNREPPLFRIIEFRVDVENETPEWEMPVLYDLADRKLG